MKSILFLLLAAVSLSASEKLLGTAQGVEIITKELFRNDGKYYGNRFYARNKKKGDASVQLHLTSSKNVIDQLSKTALTVPSEGETLFGDIVQDHPEENWEWYVDWTITR